MFYTILKTRELHYDNVRSARREEGLVALLFSHGYNSCICNIQRVVCDGTGSQHTERNIVIAKSLKNSQK